MRTVTFSDAKVAAFINANFVSAWHNRAPGFKNDDPAAEQAIFQQSSEAYTTKNICTFFMSPDGRVIHYFAGYLSPDLFLTEATLALDIRKVAFDASMKLSEDGSSKARALHAAQPLASRADPVSAVGTLAYRSLRHVHTKECGRSLWEYYEYMKGLRKHWSEVKDFPTLEAVRYSYIYGNEFTEESEGATPITGRSTGPVG
jgi:hypothetical protein